MPTDKKTLKGAKTVAKSVKEIAVDMVAVKLRNGKVVQIAKSTWESDRHKARFERNGTTLATDEEIKDNFALDSIPSEKIAEKEKVVIP